MENETDRKNKDIFWIPCAVLKPKLKNYEIISSAVAQAMDSTDLCEVQDVLYWSTTRVVANVHWNTTLQHRNNSTSDTATSACNRTSLVLTQHQWQNTTYAHSRSACNRISLMLIQDQFATEYYLCPFKIACSRISPILIQSQLQTEYYLGLYKRKVVWIKRFRHWVQVWEVAGSNPSSVL